MIMQREKEVEKAMMGLQDGKGVSNVSYEQ